jgi:hypothetical protein
MAAPTGNQNAAKAKVWHAAIMRALEKRSKLEQKEALDDLAEALLRKAADGDMGALKELGDRLDGKPAQTVDVGNADGKPFRTECIERRIVDPSDPNP